MFNESSVCVDIVGINCSCFVLDCHTFASQTPSERKLWLRAISNVKVKTQNGAPEPTKDELLYYRSSIREHIDTVRAIVEPRIVSDPLLARCPKSAIFGGVAQPGDAAAAKATDGTIDANPHTQVSL